MRTDLTVFAKDYPEARLIAEVKPAVSTPLDEDPSVKQLASYMWGANCYYGLIITPTKTYVLRDTFSASAADAIRVTDVLSTETLLRKLLHYAPIALSERELEVLTEHWLSRLASSYEDALPDDEEVMRAFFPDIVGAVADGRVVAEALMG